MLAFCERFSSGDPEAFAAGIADVPGVSVIGSGPDEGHTERSDWISTYAAMTAGAMKGTRLEGEDPRGRAEGSLGFAVDRAAEHPPGAPCFAGSRFPMSKRVLDRRPADTC